MAITVRHTPIEALGKLALQAGKVRGQEIKMGRDIQLLSIMKASEERGADIAAQRAERERDRTEKCDRALAERELRRRGHYLHRRRRTGR